MWVLALLVCAGAAAAVPCEEARMRCAYRQGCGAALNNYMMYCNDVIAEPGDSTDTCPKPCEHALIALTSTAEGKELMNCQCEDDYCQEAKRRIEVCRPQVMMGALNATSSCSLSQLICLADAECATALRYYDDLCRSMYRRGRRCSKKCLNSIQILRKQEKAAPLAKCRCDGNEDYDCPRMQNNLQRLCFHKNAHNGSHGQGAHSHNNNKEKQQKEHKKLPEEKPSTTKPVIVSFSNRCSPSWLLVFGPLFKLFLLHS